jgi:methionyl aminopeptidase
VLEDGDMVNLDVSVYVDGFHGDCSGMFVAGTIDVAGQKLIDTVQKAVRESVAICGPGVYFSKIGDVCQSIAEENGYTVVKQFCGHGIGREFHIPPIVFHHRNFEKIKMQPGMVFTIEPIFNEGSSQVMELEDGWTIVTVDGQRSAQHEEMILITETGAEVLTLHDSHRIAEQVKRAEQKKINASY